MKEANRSQSRPTLTSWLPLLAAGTCLLLAAWARADQNAGTLDVEVGKPGTKIPDQFFGLMTEEINHSYDGGLLAELIQNRSFQDPGSSKDGAPIHWSIIGPGKISTQTADPVNASLPISLRLDLVSGESGVANDGYWGIPVRPDTKYAATFYAKGGGGFAGPVTASIVTDDGNATVAKGKSDPVTAEWKKYTLTLTTGHDAPTTAKARFVLSASGGGSVWFSFVSLFPPTYQDKPNGLRPDLMKLLADLKPKFIRLPGGNYAEGMRFADRFNWKQMIGPADRRPGHMGCWSYRSSDGFGLPEYLLWCKQLGAEPVLAVFAGYVLNGDHAWPGSPEMSVYTQEALEEIEYVTGPPDSEWGKRRAADGFPEPFPLRYVEIGNEDWFDRSGSYDGRFTQIAKAIRGRYPQLKLIATAPVTSVTPDVYDDHFYRRPGQLRQMTTLYDPPHDAGRQLQFAGGAWNGRQSDGVKTFVGEWAAQEGRPTTNLNSALADAAFVMGMERNSDAVIMQCYAPLFANANLADAAKGYPRGWQWEYNLIGYDAMASYGSPSYHAQAMLSQNKGDVVLPVKLDVAATKPTSEETPKGGIGLGAWHSRVEYADLTVTAPDGRSLLGRDSMKTPRDWQTTGRAWRLQDNVITPGNDDAETWTVIATDPSWTDYTIRLRARKLAGREGFIVMFRAADSDNYQWWNVGGWNNTTTSAEVAQDGARERYGPSAAFPVEPDRWYDLRLDVKGRSIRGFVDDKLVTDATYEPRANRTPVFASATYAEADHTVIVNVVNAGSTPVEMAINLRGADRVEPTGTAIVLTGDPRATNTVDDPLNVSPKQEKIDGAAMSFRRTFGPYSFTILRLTTSAR